MDHAYECWANRPGGICRDNCSCKCHLQPEEHDRTHEALMREFGYDDRDPIEEEIDKDFFTRLFDVLLHSDSVEMRHMSNGDNIVLIHKNRTLMRGVDKSLNTALTIARNKMRILHGE